MFDNGIAFFKALGYNTERQQKLNKPTYKTFKEAFVDGNTKPFNEKKALVQNWKQVHLLFQLTKAELINQGILFDTKKVDNTIIEAYLFFAIELENGNYSRTDLSEITREINKLFPMPIMVLFKLNDTLTLSIINRRLHKTENSKDVLEKITLIKDIDIVKPHRGHLEILFDLSFQELYNNFQFDSFVSLHKAWQKTLDTNELNKKFYQKLFNWYLWATTKVNFPQIRPEEDKIPNDVHQSESLIRLLSRILFCWFMKEKGLINPKIFDIDYLKKTLHNFEGINSEETIYYKAILQNLFFATLNKPIDERKLIDPKKGYNKDHGDPLIYRYDSLFIDNQSVLSHFKNIPFLNGGLFDCLDQKKDKDNPTEIRLDGFSTNPAKQPTMPDMLFFGEYKGIDLSKEYDDKRKSKVTVYGLLDIFNDYKFTIEENTPLEEEIALDPELLGKVFENLLASYNPETKTTARKQTGSFYTPREIVNYMVDESLIAYLKNKLDDEERLRNLFSYKEVQNPFDVKETKTLIKTINEVKILDPACGSGAFPMGVLQKLIYVLHKLDPENKIWFELVIANFPASMQNVARQRLEKENWNFVRKLGIIQECIYGVDIQPIAIQISKLRFFISLLVDQTEKPNEDNRGFEPLPNLDFKLVAANTLIGAPESTEVTQGLFEDQKDEFFDEFDQLSNEFFNVHLPEEKKVKKLALLKLIDGKITEKKKTLQSSIDRNKTKEIEKGENQIKLWSTYGNLFKHESVGFFETKYFFPKVKDGFDVVIGNPPYIALQRMNDASVFANIGFKTYSKSTDLYCLFYEKGITFLKEKGHLTYITSNSWMRTKYGQAMRNYFANYSNPTLLVNFEDVQIFESAVVESNIIITQKDIFQKNLQAVNIGKDFNFTIEFSDYIHKKGVILNELDDNGWVLGDLKTLNLKKKIEDHSTAIKNLDLKINYGIRSGLNEVFIIDDEKRNDLLNIDNNNDYIIKPILRGRDLVKYSYNYANIWVILSKYKDNLNIKNNYPSIYKYLSQFEFKLKNRGQVKAGSHHWIELDNSPTEEYISNFEKPKIIWIVLSDKGKFAYDDSGCLTTDSCFIMSGNNLKYLLSVLNSKVGEWYFAQISTTSGMGTNMWKKYKIEQFPIKITTSANHLISETIVNYVLTLKKSNQDSSFFERLLDAIVYELYLPEAMASGGCLVLQHLSNLPSLLAILRYKIV